MSFAELIPTLQTAVSPVILISGIGLLLLSMTNRFGRVIDRARSVAEAGRRAEAGQEPRFKGQLKLLHRRAELLRRAITLAVYSVLCAALLVVTVFITALFQLGIGLPIAILFPASMILLIWSLCVFIQDLNLSLEAMKLDTA